LDIFSLSPFTPWHYLTVDKPFYFDISKAKTILGWQPQDSNLDMLIRSYNWYLSQRKKIDKDFGTTHKKSIRRRALRVLEEFF